jgi:hypothetical protein
MTDLDAAIASRLEAMTADRTAERLWAKDGSLWATSGKAPEEVAAWLGWLDLPEAMSARVAELEHLARDVREDGYRRAAVLGMGGSSLAPELFSRVFGWAGGAAGSGAAGVASSALFALLISFTAFALWHLARLLLTPARWRSQAFVAVLERPG